MNSISRYTAIKFLNKVRDIIDSNTELQGCLEEIFGKEFEKDEIDVLCQGVSNGYLSEMMHTITGSFVEVVGVVDDLYRCPCCGYKTLTEKYDTVEGTGYDICPHCKWEDDGTVADDKYSSVNRGTIGDYRIRMQLNKNKFYINKWHR